MTTRSYDLAIVGAGSGNMLPGQELADWRITTSFVKVLADPDTRLLLGAHLIGPQASVLIQPLIQAMYLGNTVDQVASGVLYIHPALTEVVEQALLEL
jgi:mycothione reductase